MKTCTKILSSALALLLAFCMAATGSAALAAEDVPVPTVRVVNSELEVTARYKETKYFEFEAEYLPDGAALHIYLNDEDQGERTYIYVDDPTEDYTVQGKALDAADNVIAESDMIRVTVKNGFLDRLLASVKRALWIFGDAVMDILSVPFMRILKWLYRS